jgi:hypothetical protein
MQTPKIKNKYKPGIRIDLREISCLNAKVIEMAPATYGAWQDE